jgi:hypothetical protein
MILKHRPYHVYVDAFAVGKWILMELPTVFLHNWWQIYIWEELKLWNKTIFC